MKKLDEVFEVTELEDRDLDSVSGGQGTNAEGCNNPSNCGDCTNTTGCNNGCPPGVM